VTAAAAHLRHTVAGVLAYLRISLLQVAQYRASFAIWALSSTLQAVVAMAVWRAVADANGGTTGGYDAGSFAAYFLVVLLLRELTFTGIVYHVPHRVETGKLSIYLLRPMHPLLQTFGASIANTVQAFLIIVPISITLMFVFGATFTSTPAAVAVAVALLPLAIFTRACADSLIAITSFWFIRISGIRGIYFMCTLLLGGQFAPLEVLPDWLATLARALPFYWSLGFPVELAIGTAPLREAATAIAVLTTWAIVLFVVLQPAWRAGTRQFESVGT